MAPQSIRFKNTPYKSWGFGADIDRQGKQRRTAFESEFDEPFTQWEFQDSQMEVLRHISGLC